MVKNICRLKTKLTGDPTFSKKSLQQTQPDIRYIINKESYQYRKFLYNASDDEVITMNHHSNYYQ